jgi:hypothetical protein
MTLCPKCLAPQIFPALSAGYEHPAPRMRRVWTMARRVRSKLLSACARIDPHRYDRRQQSLDHMWRRKISDTMSAGVYVNEVHISLTARIEAFSAADSWRPGNVHT